MYTVKELFYTLQGEGMNSGRPAVFCRFAGCNLWTGREADRHKAVCSFCDTDFVGVGPDGGRFADAAALADAVLSRWPAVEDGRATGGRPLVVCTGGEPLLQLDAAAVAAQWPSDERARRFVVCTGGEPLLQLDAPLVDAFHRQGFEIAIETNGTQPAPPGIDWICVSPKADAALVLTAGDELKLVYPQPGVDPARFESLAFRHFALQPMDGPERHRNTELAIRYCMANPRWRLSLQTHKLIGIR